VFESGDDSIVAVGGRSARRRDGRRASFLPSFVFLRRASSSFASLFTSFDRLPTPRLLPLRQPARQTVRNKVVIARRSAISVSVDELLIWREIGI